jgi:hypothetical protein
MAACGGDDGASVDAPPKDIGFTKPTKSLKSNMETAENQWTEIGPADLACLNTANNDMATTVAVALATKVTDFQSGNLAPGTSVTVFPDQSEDAPFGPPVIADEMAKLTVNIPIGTKRFGFKMTSDSALDTLLLNQTVLPGQAAQTLGQIQSVSKTTAQTLPALIGVSRTAGTGVLAGAVRDCSNKEISNFIATVSSTKGEVNHVAGTDTYYFSSSVGLPVRHSQKAASSEDGLFMVIELQPAPTAFVQVWGFLNDTDLAADKLTLVAELETEVINDTVITGSYAPLRQ